MGGKKDKKKGKKKDAQGKGKKDSKGTGKKKKVICPRCEEKISAKSRFCPQCGCELQAAREEDHLMAELDTLDDLELPAVPPESARASQLPVTVPSQVAAAPQVPTPYRASRKSPPIGRGPRLLLSPRWLPRRSSRRRSSRLRFRMTLMHR